MCHPVRSRPLKIRVKPAGTLAATTLTRTVAAGRRPEARLDEKPFYRLQQVLANVERRLYTAEIRWPEPTENPCASRDPRQLGPAGETVPAAVLLVVRNYGDTGLIPCGRL